MKRNAILSALALLACGVAGAQSSSATLFGVIDAGVARLSATGGAHATGLGSGGNGTSRLGFRGTEDLGGGYSARIADIVEAHANTFRLAQELYF